MMNVNLNCLAIESMHLKIGCEKKNYSYQNVTRLKTVAKTLQTYGSDTRINYITIE